MAENEKQFEANIEEYLISPAGGYQQADDSGYRDSIDMELDIKTLVRFVKTTQPLVWQRFEKQCNSDPLRKFYKCFEDAVPMVLFLSCDMALGTVEWISRSAISSQNLHSMTWR